MQKDVIYIDVEDDITAIIGKVKAADHKIIALVPPKRIGAIQSAVNLKLVQRAAEQSGKRLVIISNNAALTALSSAAGIPVSKNLQSKPELAEVPPLEVDEGEDVIDGAALPVGEHAALAESSVYETVAPAVGSAATEKPKAVATPSSRPKVRGAGKSKIKVPDFDIFRKKLFIGVAAALLLIGGLVWALVFAPHARVIITARTTDVALASTISTGDSLATDLKAGTVKSATKTLKKEVSIPFTATGKKDIGEKATGTVKYSNDGLSAATIPAGTQVSAGGFTFITNEAVTVPGPTIGSCGGRACIVNGTATGTITAAEPGSRYNGVSGAVSAAGVSGTLSAATSGGTDKVATVVTQEDVDKVSGDVSKAGASDAAKKDLIAQFGKDYVVMDASFKADAGSVKPSPAVGAEASDGKGTLTGSVNYTLIALPKSELGKYLDEYFDQQLDGKNDQKIYANGLSAVSLTNISVGENGGATANISTNGKVGPKIDEVSLKEYAKGKRYGDIQSYVKEIDGVDNVDVKFSPFWVSSAPNDTKKITVEFKVNGT